MFKHRTVFIVGAGAGEELGLPVGRKLANKIRTMMDVRFERGFEPIGEGDYGLYSQLSHIFPKHGPQLQEAAGRIYDGIGLVAQSIDDFLDQHRDDQLVNLYGKAAIVQAIAEAERASKLWVDMAKGENTFDDQKLADTWIIRFMHMLCRGLPRADVGKVFDRVSFIVFNYDRCIEHFLVHALRRGYALDQQDAVSIVDGLNIVHPYGTIGDLKRVPFGSTRLNWTSVSKDIKTYTEQAGTDLVPTLRDMVQNAEHIVFLGFAYYDQNMAMLTPGPLLVERKRVFGTAYGMSDSDVDVVSNQIDRWYISHHVPRSDRVRIENKLKCAALFDFHAKSLTA
jgi:hypothetical protein